MKVALSLLSLLLVGSCSSPPAPPTVDERHKRPANAHAEVELQRCTGELHESQLALADSAQEAAKTRTSFSRLAALDRAASQDCIPAPDGRGTVYTILFPFAGTRVALSAAQGERLLRATRDAPLIVLRGRTDGSVESGAESRVARGRVEAVRDYLVSGGIRAAQIRTTWQPVGDPAADNTTASGRALNRRVEVELYRVAPRAATWGEADPA